MALNLKIPSKSAGNAIPSNLTTLSISWLNKQFKAASIHRGLVERTWECPDEVEGTSNLDTLLKDAVQHTGYRGQTVTLVLGHSRMVQQLVDLPPVKGQALTKLVQRQAAQQKLFQGEAAFTYELSPSPKGTQRVILHLFPRILLNQLSQACRKHNLFLRAVFPPSVIVHHQMSAFPAGKDEVDLLAAETAGTTQVVISRNDGQILLARTLPGSWNEDTARLALDVNRTILFATQQHGINIKKEIWVFGRGAKEQAMTLQEKLQLLVKLSPTDETPLYWATEAAKLRASAVPNFITAEMQAAPQRRIFARVVAAGTVLLFLGSLAMSGYALLQARRESAVIKSLSGQITKAQTRQLELQQRNYEMSRKQQISTLIVDMRPAPVPVWLLAYLSEAVPQDIVLHEFTVVRTNEAWHVHLHGMVAGSASTNTAFTVDPIELFRSRLVEGPFRLAIDYGTNNAAPEKAATNGGDTSANDVLKWLARMKPTVQQAMGVTNAAPIPVPIQTEFVIQGVMQ